MSTDDYVQKIQAQPEVTDEQSQQAGTPVSGSIGDEHKNFAQTITNLIDAEKIDIGNPQTFLQQDVYQTLDQEWKDKTDLALVNISNQLQLIYNFYKDDSFTNDSPQLQTMIEQLWQMKQEIEKQHNVFIF